MTEETFEPRENDAAVKDILERMSKRIRGSELAKRLEVSPSYWSKMLTGLEPAAKQEKTGSKQEDTGRRITQKIKRQVLTQWRELGLNVPELRRLHDIWRDASEATRVERYFDCPATMFGALPLVAQELGYFNDKVLPTYEIKTRFREARFQEKEMPLTPDDVIANVQQGRAHFGIVHSQRMVGCENSVFELGRLFRSTEPRLCVPRSLYEELLADRNGVIPLFADLTKYITSHKRKDGREWKIYAAEKTIARDFVVWLLEKMKTGSPPKSLMNRDTLEEYIAAISYDEVIQGDWPDDTGIMVGLPPAPFLHTHGEDGAKSRYIELIETGYDRDKQGNGLPHFQRHTQKMGDIYQVSREFGRQAYVIFTQRALPIEETDFCLSVMVSLYAANCKINDALRDEKMMSIANALTEPFREMLGFPETKRYQPNGEFAEYLRSELVYMEPVLDIDPEISRALANFRNF